MTHRTGTVTRVRRAAARAFSSMRHILPLPPRRGVRILVYHAIGSVLPFEHYGISLPPDAFARQMAALDPSEVLPLRMLRSRGHGIVLTFDDGYRDFAEVALPVLERHSLPATLFITASFAESGQPVYLDTGLVCALARHPLIEIGAHGMTHARLPGCNDEQLRHELRGARETLQNWSGSEVRSLAYPHGAAGPRERHAAADAGYDLACSGRFGVNTGATDPLLLRRIEIVAADSDATFEQKVGGAWDWRGAALLN